MSQPTACHKSCLIPLLDSHQGTVGGPALQREPSDLLRLCIPDVHLIHKCHWEHTQRNVWPNAWLPWLGQTDMWHSPPQCNIQGEGGLPFRGFSFSFGIVLSHSPHIYSFIKYFLRDCLQGIVLSPGALLTKQFTGQNSSSSSNEPTLLIWTLCTVALDNVHKIRYKMREGLFSTKNLRKHHL